MPTGSGFAFWLNINSDFNGNFERAEMVKAFIVSGEYRDRFVHTLKNGPLSNVQGQL